MPESIIVDALEQQDTDLQLIADIRDVLAKSPNDREAHTSLIEVLRSQGHTDDLESARIQMDRALALSEDMWKDWIDDQSRMATTKDKILQLDRYSRSVTDHPWSTSLWCQYLQFVKHQITSIGAGSPDLEASEYFNNDFLESLYIDALNETQYDLLYSHKVWDAYLLDQQSKLDRREIDVITIEQLFYNRLSIPHLRIADTFTALSTFVTKHDNNNYEKILSKANVIYRKTKAFTEEREELEYALEQNAHDLGQYMKYLAWQRSKPAKDLHCVEMIQGILQRAIAHHPNVAFLWTDLFNLLVGRNPNEPEAAQTILHRALRFCKTDAELWAALLRTSSRCHMQASDIMELKDEAISNIEPSPDQLSKIYASCSLALRHLSVSNEQQIRLLQTGLDLLSDYFISDEDFLLERLLIAHKTQDGHIDAARRTWKGLMKKHNEKALFWLRYLHWELLQGNIAGARTLLKSACLQAKDAPQLVFEAATTFELQYGTPLDYEKTAVVVSKATRAFLQSHESLQQAELEEVQATIDSDNDKPKRKAEDEATDQSAKRVKTIAAKPSGHRSRESTSVIVQGLTKSADHENLARFFQDCGRINTLNRQQIGHTDDFVAAIEFVDDSDMAAALTKTLKTFQGKQITVNSAANTILFVTNCLPSHTDQDLRALFSEFGHVLDVRMPSLMYDQKRRFAYIQMTTKEQAEAALSLDGTDLGDDCVLSVKLSDPEAKQDRQTAASEAREIVVKNVSWRAALREVDAHFSEFGKIVSIRMPKTISNKHHNGIAFVDFESAESAQQALSADGKPLLGRSIQVVLSEPRPRNKKASTQISTTSDTQDRGESKPAFSDIKAKTLGIMHLPDTVNEVQLRNLVEPYGKLRKVVLRPDHAGAVVEYESPVDAGRASLALQGQTIGGAVIAVGTHEDLMQQPSAQVKGLSPDTSRKPLSMAPRKVRHAVANPKIPKKKPGETASGTISTPFLADESAQAQALDVLETRLPRKKNQDFFRQLMHGEEQGKEEPPNGA